MHTVRRSILAFAALVIAAPPASAAWTTYADWAAEPPAERAHTLAAFFEGLTVLNHNDSLGTWTKHFKACVEKAGMTPEQLAAGLEAHVAAHESYKDGALFPTLGNYLEATCGDPPEQM